MVLSFTAGNFKHCFSFVNLTPGHHIGTVESLNANIEYSNKGVICDF